MTQHVILKKWRGRIEKAIKRGHFTMKDKHDAYSWNKCAVGERDCMCEKIIPKDMINYDKGEVVRTKMFDRVVTLGSLFHVHVSADKPKQALKTLEKIEAIPKKRFYL